MPEHPEVEPSLAGFTSVYERHVDLVRRGDLRAVMADMDPAKLDTVFTDVEVPRDRVISTEIREVRVEDGRGVGDCVYTTDSATIGLRSGWHHDGTSWLADELSNFEV